LEFTQQFLEGRARDPNGPTIEELSVGEHSILQEARRILGRCLPPTDGGGRETGLVIGYVQSGKTMSFETVISLARDNGYGVVIVFAGTKTNLREQSEDRLKKDLGIDEGENWYHYSNPNAKSASEIADKISAWKKRPDRKRAVLITVLKWGSHLDNLSAMLADVPLAGVPVLIVDDESDQASLNTFAARIRAARTATSTMSAVYEAISRVRDRLPHHSYLQYTATPQANLLLAQTDLLNPSFAELVSPGPSYTGGRSFFPTKSPNLLVDIPPAEVPSPTNQLNSAPKSLLSALRFFLLVASHHSLTKARTGGKAKDRNRSMMVHPAMQTNSHRTYLGWVDKSFRTLKALVLRQYEKDLPSVEAKFQREYESLKKTHPDIRPLSELIVEMADEVLDGIKIALINGTKDAEKNVDWKAHKYWILVGGAKLDRGYTVEGLAITYMPRGLGNSPAADTLQQRARFFGYKLGYLGLCRVFLQADVREAFTKYVEHEEFVRSALVKNRGMPLKQWRRDFVLSSLLRPTRPNVIGLSARRVLVENWNTPSVLQMDQFAAEDNRKLLADVVANWTKSFGMPVNASDYHQATGAKKSPTFVLQDIPLRSVLEDFLLKVEIRDSADAEDHSALLIGLSEVLRKNEGALVDVFLINNLSSQYRTRAAGRGLPAGHKFAPINQYFSNSADVMNDRNMRASDRISLQLRRFNLGTKERDPRSADTFDVPWYALYVPKRFKKELHIESR
jgi:hypothetical protein